MAHRSVPKTQFLLIVCLLSSSLAFAISGASTVAGLPGFISGGYYQQLYSAALQSSFGTPSYTYTLVGGALPPGITMNSAGKITGTPGDTGIFNFQVRASDSSKPPVSQTSSYSMNISIGFDAYGGLTAAHSAKPATGYFHLEKQNGRWKLVSLQEMTSICSPSSTPTKASWSRGLSRSVITATPSCGQPIAASAC